MGHIYLNNYEIMGFEFFKKAAKKAENMDDFTKVVLTAGTAAAAMGGAAGIETYTHEQHMAPNAQMPNFDTMPTGFENPTAGKTPQSAPDPIVMPKLSPEDEKIIAEVNREQGDLQALADQKAEGHHVP